MSMENELKRIAGALEAMAEKVCGGNGKPREVETAPVIEKKRGRKPASKADELIPAGPEQSQDEVMTPKGLMVYCNGELSKIPAADRAAIIRKVVAMFKEEFGVSSVKETPADRAEEAKEAFDAILNGEE